MSSEKKFDWSDLHLLGLLGVILSVAFGIAMPIMDWGRGTLKEWWIYVRIFVCLPIPFVALYFGAGWMAGRSRRP